MGLVDVRPGVQGSVRTIEWGDARQIKFQFEGDPADLIVLLKSVGVHVFEAKVLDTEEPSVRSAIETGRKV